MTVRPPVGATDSPDEPLQRFGLTLTRNDFDKLGAALEVINEAERRALSGPDFVGAVATVRALHFATASSSGGANCGGCSHFWPCPTIAALDRAGCP